MTNPFAWLKHRLSHTKESSLHFKATQFIWKDKAYGKACSFYWWKLPSALLVLALISIFVVALTVIGAFFGFAGTFLDTRDERLKWDHDNRLFYPYKTLPSGRLIPIAPWEIAAVVAVAFAIYYLAAVDQSMGLTILTYVSLGLGALLVVGISCALIVFAVLKGWKHPLLAKARSNVSAAWDRVCPELEVEPE